MNIQFRVYGAPKGQPRPRAFARKVGDKVIVRAYNPGTAEEWKSQIAFAARAHVPAQPIAGPVELTAQLYFKRPKAHFRSSGEPKPDAPRYHQTKPDADNAAKAIMDALTALGFWSDDKQVVSLCVDKEYGQQGANIIIRAL